MDVKTVFDNLLRNPILIFNIIRIKIISWRLSKKIDGGWGKIIYKDHNVKVIIEKGANSKIILDGNLVLNSHLRGRSPIRILLSDEAILHIKGDFTIGNGVCISISKNGKLVIGGRKNESDSGITADSTIMVHSKINIGNDFICAWGVFISDSDWHYIEGQAPQKDVIIGNHVWIANNSNILKGVEIGNNCIVASNSKLINKHFPSNSLIAGIPGNVVKTGITWKRDL
jgi:acetyltransferase-like isoleucine patch superfamily enzyme